MSTAAEGHVYVDAAFTQFQPFDTGFQQHGDMIYGVF
jgi:hypothetical protein